MERPSLPQLDLRETAFALRAQSTGREVGELFAGESIPALALKGPELQERLFGNPAAYVSGDIDILVRRRDAARARDLLIWSGWKFDPGNGFLWRLSRAATYERQGVSVDLHWGLHAAHLTGRSLRFLERDLWSRASRGQSVLFIPDEDALFVFLALHAAGHRFERPQWRAAALRAANEVRDWNRVWAVADRAGVRSAVCAVLETDPTVGERLSLLDGVKGTLESSATWVLRGHFLPARIRGILRKARTLVD